MLKQSGRKEQMSPSFQDWKVVVNESIEHLKNTRELEAQGLFMPSIKIREIEGCAYYRQALLHSELSNITPR